MRLASFVAFWGLASLALQSPVFACQPAPHPVPSLFSEEVGRREANRVSELQRNDWESAPSVFIARAVDHRLVRVGRHRQMMRVTLVPLLQIKGTGSISRIVIRQSMGVCGPTPDFDAFTDEASGEYYVVYSNSGRPTADTIFSTVRIDKLVDPQTIRAWTNVQSRIDPPS